MTRGREYLPLQIQLLEGRVVGIQRAWYPTDLGVWRVTYYATDSSPLSGCQATIRGRRFVELSAEDLELIRIERKKAIADAVAKGLIATR